MASEAAAVVPHPCCCGTVDTRIPVQQSGQRIGGCGPLEQFWRKPQDYDGGVVRYTTSALKRGYSREDIERIIVAPLLLRCIP